MMKLIIDRIKEKKKEYLIYLGFTIMYSIGFVKLWLHWLALS